ncbi:MAG: anti-sigma regulatory factor (Ser/Thr protein kinase) [Actinomycetia bacterium]|nr:anti-sigma regulatory factor (Ser/Thr protein kinase) [Actinomycetes bacterium]
MKSERYGGEARVKRARTRFNFRNRGNSLAVPLVFELEIPARASEVGSVRRAIRAAVVRYGLDGEHADTAQLVASELVMNATLHGGAPILVRMSIERDATVLEVHDSGNDLPDLASLLESEPGRGLRVVDALCDDWGSLTDDAGKTVWATIRHTSDPLPAEEAHKRRAADRPPR